MSSTQTPNKATRGAIVGTALFVGIVTGGFYLSEPAATRPAPQPESAACHVFAGRAGTLPCTNRYANTHDSQVARKVVGTTFTGCFLGLVSGGPVGAGYGCLGGLASNIPW